MTTKIFISISRLLCFFFLFSCLEDNLPPDPVNPEITEREKLLKNLYESVKKEYYWYDELKEISYTSSKYYNKESLPYESIALSAYFNDIKYSEDKWSYVGPFIIYASSSSSGKLYGFRYNLKKEEETLFLRIVYVIPNSPIDRAGMKRGDRIIRFQATESEQDLFDEGIIDTTLSENLNLYQEKIFNSTSGRFVLEDATGNEREIWSTREIIDTPYFFNINQGETNDIKKRFAPTLITLSNKKNTKTKNIGYVIYASFNDKSVVDLLNMFYFWKQNDVKDVIFDLRYNGGGRVDVTQFIVSMLINDFEKTFTRLDFKEVSPYRDEIYPIKEIDTAFLKRNFGITNSYPAENIVNLDITSAYFLVTKDSASASELLIRALEPYINVTVVGENTHGKGYGQVPKTVSDQGYIYNKSIINFRYFNADNEGVEFTGIPPTSGFTSSDDITQNWGAGENLFDLAINALQEELEQEKVTFRRFSNRLNKYNDNTYYSFVIDAPEEKIKIPYEREWQ